MAPDFRNITIKDIARMAGVSAGTVDRVLHNRGKVSSENLKKINDVLEKVDYNPNLIASALSSKKKYYIAVVIPSYKKGEYWESVSLGIDAAEREFSQFGIRIEKIFFDQYDSNSLEIKKKEILSKNIDGVVLAVLFKKEFEELSEKLSQNEIPYVYMDFNLQGNQLAFYGTDSFFGGKLSARMFLTLTSINDDILMVLLNVKNGMRSNQSINREKGFLNYLQEKKYRGNIHRLNLEYLNEDYNNKVLNDFFSQNKVKGVIVFNSTCHIVANYFKKRNISNIALVGYDGIAENIQMMKEGFVDVLISQRPYFQGYEATKSLCNFLLKKIVPKSENYIPLDVVVNENVEFYNLQ